MKALAGLLLLAMVAAAHAAPVSESYMVTVKQAHAQAVADFWGNGFSWEWMHEKLPKLQAGETITVNGILVSTTQGDIVLPQALVDRLSIQKTETGFYINHYARSDIVSELINLFMPLVSKRKAIFRVPVKGIGSLEVVIE